MLSASTILLLTTMAGNNGIDRLSELGFYFSESGALLDTKTSEPFIFDYYEEIRKNQVRYEEIGDAVTEHIYQLLMNEVGLEKHFIPLNDTPGISSFIFASRDFKVSVKKKLALINGSGVVRAGQWARSIIINDNIYRGSMLPYIKWGQDHDYDIIVFNTNESGKGKFGSETPLEHAHTVWAEFINPLDTSEVHIVAHSYGGAVVKSLATEESDFQTKVAKVAFTDSVHIGKISADVPMINWVSSNKAVDTVLGKRSGCIIRSAGTPSHTWTSHFAKESIFQWLSEDNDKPLEQPPTSDVNVHAYTVESSQRNISGTSQNATTEATLPKYDL